MNLANHARAYIEQRYRRPWRDRLLRAALAAVLPYPGRFRVALALARLARPAMPLVLRIVPLRSVAAMLALAPAERVARPSIAPSRKADARGRVALLQGCAEPALRPEIRAATVRLLERAGYDVVFARGEGCCGALVNHMGKDAASFDAARRNVDAWTREIDAGGLGAIVVTASGCGTVIEDYSFMLRDDPGYAERAARVSGLAKDVSEVLIDAVLPPGEGRGLVVAYYAACSLQHGQNLTEAPRRLLAHAGYLVRTPIEQHLCCGAAGVYNILQPTIAGRLGDRKVANLNRLDADVIATGNIGCAMQIGQRAAVPVVHTVELLDWATGGPPPRAMAHLHERTDS